MPPNVTPPPFPSTQQYELCTKVSRMLWKALQSIIKILCFHTIYIVSFIFGVIFKGELGRK